MAKLHIKMNVMFSIGFIFRIVFIVCMFKQPSTGDAETVLAERKKRVLPERAKNASLAHKSEWVESMHQVYARIMWTVHYHALCKKQFTSSHIK